MSGLIHIYCGDGKGKTTSAVGLSVRAAGSGMQVLFTQFLKSGTSNEVKVLETIPGIRVKRCDDFFGFYFKMDEEQKRKAAEAYSAYFEDIIREEALKGIDVLVMDEIIGAISCKLVSQERVAEFLKSKPEQLEVVMTGRDPGEELVALADYVSCIDKVKHPYDQGVKARKGIEI